MSQLALSVTLQPGYSQQSAGMIQTSEGDYILVGKTSGQQTPARAFAIRYDPRLTEPIVWQKTYSDTFDVFFQSVAQIADGTFIAVGSRFRSQFAGSQELWIVNLDAKGNLIWKTTYGQQGIQTDGYGVVAATDGFVVAGAFYPEVDSDATAVLKYSMQRSLLWERRSFQGGCLAMAATRDGGVILTGRHSIPGSTNDNPYLLRLNGNGTPAWERVYSQIKLYEILKGGVIETVGGFIVVTKGTILGIDPSGNLVWSRQSGNVDLGSVAELPDGTYAVGGSQIVGNVDHAYVANLDSSFQQILWDNTELLPSSDLTVLIVNRDRLVTGFGDLPWIGEQSQLVFAIFYPRRIFSSAEEDPGPAES
jgi:hypothetical protein